MSGRLLDFKRYIGGADNVQVIEKFTNEQKTMTYNFNTDITNYTFELDAQTIVVDTLTYNVSDGNPNFTNSVVTGYYANIDVSTANVSSRNNAAGTVNITIPANLYTDVITPDARANVPITVFSVSWTNTGVTPNVTSAHRWAILNRYSPGTNAIGNPTLSNVYIPIGTGAISTFTNNSSADALRANAVGTYNAVTGLSTQEGTGSTFQVIVAADGSCTFNLTARGANYAVGDTIKILDSSLGGFGGADITVTVASVG